MITREAPGARTADNGRADRASDAGNNVVLLGFDLASPKVAGLLGSGIQRTDHTEGQQYWLPISWVSPAPIPAPRCVPTLIRCRASGGTITPPNLITGTPTVWSPSPAAPAS